MFMGSRPRIGLTMRLEIETRRFYLGRDYSEALEGAGALPVHIPLIADSRYIGELVRGLDGLLLPGSDTDVDPSYFGEEPHPNLKRVVPEKDLTDLLALEVAEEAGIPVLAICYGMQVLNVFRRGSLIQDIGSLVDGCVKHEQGIPLERRSHSIRISEEGILAGIVNGNGGAAEKLKVNSHHHQAIGRVGEGLTATAWAPDGVVECIEDTRNGRFVLGVQWHPELDWRSDRLSRSIFESFVRSCG